MLNKLRFRSLFEGKHINKVSLIIVEFPNKNLITERKKTLSAI